MIKNKIDKKILIAYGSNYGSTREIAEHLGKYLRDKGFEIDSLNLNTQKRKFSMNLDKYEGFIIGSGIYAGSWTSKITKFIKKNAAALKQKDIAAFAVCGESHNPDRIEIARINYVEKYLKKYGIIPDFGIAFAGVLDLSSTTPYSKLEQKIIRMINKKDSAVLMHEKNDFRNWEIVEKFADDFTQFFQFIAETKNFSHNIKFQNNF